MPGNPFDQLAARIDQLTVRVAALTTRVSELETRVNALIANQVKWAPGYRFPLPPIQAS